jgi:arylsulfatase A-like enzyme
MFGYRRMFVWTLLANCVVALLPALSMAEKPNILFIFSDDHARAAISAYGSKVNQTPHLDQLATKGAKFLQSFVTNSICTPSRATLLTGQYSHLNGVPVFNRFDGSRDHVAKHLQKNGYHTGMIGKWHLGSDPTGFDRWIVLPGQGSYVDPAFVTPQGRVTIAGHCTEVTTKLGMEFLENRPKDKPFFLMLHHKAPHRAWDPDEKNKALFAGKEFVEPKTLFDDYKTRPAALPENEQTVAKDLTRRDLKLTPPEGLPPQQRNAWLNEKPMRLEVNGQMLEGADLVRWKYQRYMQDYLACVQGVDDSIGQVMEYLKKNDLEKNTIVIYTSDNGWYLGELGMYDKRFMYEPGLRTPLLAAGPGIRSGIEPTAMVANIDIAPTLLDLAGCEIPEFMQGVSFKPLLQGDTPANWRKTVYYRYYHSPGHHNTQAHYGVRTETHKLIYYWNKKLYEMFDLRVDAEEQNNLMFEGEEKLSPENKKVFAALQTEIQRLQTEYRDEGQYANQADWPKGGVDGPFDGVKPLGRKTVEEAFSLTTSAALTK